MDALLAFGSFVAAVGGFVAGMLFQLLRRQGIAGIARPISSLRSAAVVAKQRDDEPVTYCMIGPQRLTKAEADADLERWRRAQISAASDPRTKRRDH